MADLAGLAAGGGAEEDLAAGVLDGFPEDFQGCGRRLAGLASAEHECSAGFAGEDLLLGLVGGEGEVLLGPGEDVPFGFRLGGGGQVGRFLGGTGDQGLGDGLGGGRFCRIGGEAGVEEADRVLRLRRLRS